MTFAFLNPTDNALLLVCAGLLCLNAWQFWRGHMEHAELRMYREDHLERFRLAANEGRAIELAKTGGEARSPQWPALRKKFLQGKVCAACGKSDALEAHHVKNFREHRDLELVESNLIPLCEHPSRTCHWHFGHNALEWRTCNPHVRDDAAQFLERRAHAA